MPSPPYSPGGRLIECSTTVSTRAPAGRELKLGDGTRLAWRHQPPCQSSSARSGDAVMRASGRVGRLGLGDPEPRHPVAHLAQREPEARARGGAVEALALERPNEDHA